MRRTGIVLALCVVVGVGFLMMAGSESAVGAGDKKIIKLDHRRLKVIIGKIDPEIKAAQVALQRARKDIEIAHARIKAAILDEVFGESGATEAHVIDQLKAANKSNSHALTEINAAIKHANIAQLLDTGKE
jgi:hypothetical protein